MHRERGRLQRKWSDPGSTRGVEDAATALLVDAAAFDLRAGFTELAVARIQAALEFNLFRPASVVGEVQMIAAHCVRPCCRLLTQQQLPCLGIKSTAYVRWSDCKPLHATPW